MIFRLSIALLLLTCPSCSASQNNGTESIKLDSAKARQAAVETGLLTRSWARGHGFDIEERMRILEVPGVSVAVIRNGKIDWAAGYGVRDETSGLPVTTETLFQAASISKPVSALAALRLAQDGLLDLDTPINELLKSYKLPDSEFGGEVTARRILNHSAGLNVDGFAGYRVGEPIPTATDLLLGRGNSEALRQIEPTGQRYRYSGGGSTMLQVAMTDITGRDFNSIVQEQVLLPLSMTRSTYEQPISDDTWPNHSAAHDYAGRRIPGGSNVYPEQFPAGLWTTPSDLARFVLEVQRVAGGEDGLVLNAESGEQMLTPAFRGAGLGLFIEDFGGEQWFEHSGSNKGFKCDFRASFVGGNGVIVMTNSDTGFELCREIIRTVAHVYGWTGMVGDPLEQAAVQAEQLNNYAGHYDFGPDEIAFITVEDEQMTIQQLPYPRMPLVPLGAHRFQILGTEFHVEFQSDESGAIESMSMSMAPDHRAMRMGEDEYWPVKDLLLGDAEDAVAHYTKAHIQDDTNPMVDCDRLIQMTKGLLKFADPQAALVLGEAITGLYPDDANAWDMLGQVRFELGDLEGSLQAYRTCLQLIPSDESLDDAQRDLIEEHTRARLRNLRN